VAQVVESLPRKLDALLQKEECGGFCRKLILLVGKEERLTFQGRYH
jgi:hypothetical protein